MIEIVIGRTPQEKEAIGTKGAILLGKQYVKMGHVTSLSNPVFMDVTRSHVVFVCGKRGGGKSYTMGVIAEGMTSLPEEVSRNLAVIMLDTMGIYWTMKYPNRKDEALLREWDIQPMGYNAKIYTPKGYFKQYKDEGIPTDFPFAIRPGQLDASDWCTTFGIDQKSPGGVLISRIISKLKKTAKGYSLQDIVKEAQDDPRSTQETKDSVEGLFVNAENWGLFDEAGTSFAELVSPGQISVIDVSCYATIPGASSVRSLVIGLVAEKLFVERMVAKKKEEYEDINQAVNYFSSDASEDKRDFPMVWLIVDEAHEFIPKDGVTAATDPLITILREGRQPGISLVLASQQPGKIHTDVMTQSDIVISHRLTAKIDTDALGALMQSYMRDSLPVQLDNLPKVKGSAVVFDDVNERLYPIKVRPRNSWHGGEAPTAISKKENRLSLSFLGKKAT